MTMEGRDMAEDAELVAHWQDGRLMIRRCESCRKAHWYPRSLCPFCMGQTRWEPCSGRATVYACSVTRRVRPEPYCIAYVELEEGPKMMTNIVGCDLEQVRIGAAVHVVFQPSGEGRQVPMFTLD